MPHKLVKTIRLATKTIERIPRLPKLSLKSALPLLPIVCSPGTVALIISTYNLYTSTRTVCETIRRPLEYYQVARTCVKGCFSRAPIKTPFEHLCDNDSSEWIMLFPDDEHRTSQ